MYNKNYKPSLSSTRKVPYNFTVKTVKKDNYNG